MKTDNGYVVRPPIAALSIKRAFDRMPFRELIRQDRETMPRYKRQILDNCLDEKLLSVQECLKLLEE